MDFNIIFGSVSLERLDTYPLLKTIYLSLPDLGLDYSRVKYIQPSLGKISLLEIGPSHNRTFSDTLSRNNDLFSIHFLCGTDSNNHKYIGDEKNLSIYCGSFQPNNISYNILLPIPVYSEEDGCFINLEGRLRELTKAIYSRSKVMSLSKIFQASRIRSKNIILENLEQHYQMDKLNSFLKCYIIIIATITIIWVQFINHEIKFLIQILLFPTFILKNHSNFYQISPYS